MSLTVRTGMRPVNPFTVRHQGDGGLTFIVSAAAPRSASARSMPPPTWTGEKTTSGIAASVTHLHTDSDTTIAMLQSTKRKIETERRSADNTNFENIMGLPAKSERGSSAG